MIVSPGVIGLDEQYRARPIPLRPAGALPQHGAEVVEKLRVVGPKPQGLAQGCFRFRQLPQTSAGECQVAVVVGLGRRDRDGRPQVVGGVREPSLLECDHAQQMHACGCLGSTCKACRYIGSANDRPPAL